MFEAIAFAVYLYSRQPLVLDGEGVRERAIESEDALVVASVTYEESDFLARGDWTEAIARQVSLCWTRAGQDCLSECGGSLLYATNFCRVLRDGSVVSFGLGCQMQAGYDACAETYKLRKEVERLREELAKRPCNEDGP